MKINFTSNEMHTPEYKEYVKWTSDVWRMNNERNSTSDKSISIIHYDHKDLLEAL